MNQLLRGFSRPLKNFPNFAQENPEKVKGKKPPAQTIRQQSLSGSTHSRRTMTKSAPEI